MNEWDGITYDYTKKGGIVHSEIMLPAHAPQDFQDRSLLWNSVEHVEKSRNAQLSRNSPVNPPAFKSQKGSHTLEKKIEKTTYQAKIHFSKTSKETMNDKIKRMLRHEIQET